MIVYFVRVRNRKKKLHKKIKKTKNKSKKTGKKKTRTIHITKRTKDFPSDDIMLKKLSTIEEPVNKHDYNNLDLFFDKNGKIIK